MERMSPVSERQASRNRAVVLLSGGLDSATALAQANADGLDCLALTVRYGQRHRLEIEYARRVAQHLGVADHRIVDLNLSSFGGSSLFPRGAVPEARPVGEDAVQTGGSSRSSNGGNDPSSEIPSTYVPARNTVFLSLALAWAEASDAAAIYIGVNALDYSGYPDCRPEYLRAFQRMADLATRRGVEGRPIEIRAPLLELSKAQIIERGRELGVDYSLTWSCYSPGPEGRPCGRCDACAIRRRGFAELGIPDPAMERS
jgi:7-cyano-7-deazaguanine synthase